MQKILIIGLLIMSSMIHAQNSSSSPQTENAQSSDNKQEGKVFKKRVLEIAELDVLSSFYTQEGSNAAVTGGIGNEALSDFATNFIISIPLNADDVLTIDATVSAYSSASSSNLNPFSGASEGGGGEYGGGGGTGPTKGSPWVASSGASKNDVWLSSTIDYSHSSDDRNTIWGLNASVAHEYDYNSIGFGAHISKLFNQKNTEVGLKTNVYLDKWNPVYPTEIIEYVHSGGNLYTGFFNGEDILDSNGTATFKGGLNTWSAFNKTLVADNSRNTYSTSLSLSQILSKRSQISLFMDIVMQKGWLANPMQRVYFADRANYYIGTASHISNYTNTRNTQVFQLADDIERLPNNRLKTPVGARFNYYINEAIVIRTYYRYYFDDWGLNAHTANVELPIKVSSKVTFYPSYRYYEQTAAKYFAAYEEHLSSDEFYTSDYDLSKYNSYQFGFGLKYNDALIKSTGLKTFTLNYSYYKRSTGLNAHIISLGAKFILSK